MTSTTISDRRRPQTKEKTEGRDLNHHNKKWMSWYCQWALQQQSKMALQVSLWSLSPHRSISILTAHKTVVLLNMCCLSTLDWNLLHILFLLRRCHMNQEKNTLVGRSAISSTDACIIMDQIFQKEVCASEAAVSNKQNQDSVFFYCSTLPPLIPPTWSLCCTCWQWIGQILSICFQVPIFGRHCRRKKRFASEFWFRPHSQRWCQKPKKSGHMKRLCSQKLDKLSAGNQEIVFCSCEFFSIDVQRWRRLSGVLTQNSKITSKGLEEVDPVFSTRSLQCLLPLHKSPIRRRWCESRSKHDSFSEKLIQLQISERLTPLRNKLHML